MKTLALKRVTLLKSSVSSIEGVTFKSTKLTEGAGPQFPLEEEDESTMMGVGAGDLVC